MKTGDYLTVEVQAIANGFLVTERKRGDDFTEGRSDPLFYPDIASVENDLVNRLRAADALPCNEENF